MRRTLLFALIALCLALVPGSLNVSAQAPEGIEFLQVSLWPEYDRQGMLVIYRLQLAESASTPATVVVPIPASVGEPHAVAVRAQNGSLFVAPYAREVEGAWAMITIEMDSLESQVEFYDSIHVDGDDRSYVFQWPEGYPVNGFAYEIQQPLGADGLEIAPPPDGEEIHADGLTYFTADLGPQSEGSGMRIDISYRKAGNGLTFEELSLAPSALSRPETTSGTTPDPMELLPWIIGGLGAALLAGGAVLYFRSRQMKDRDKPRTRRRRRPSPASQRGSQVSDEETRFCHHCGAQAQPGDRFCRGCGAKIRQ